MDGYLLVAIFHVNDLIILASNVTQLKCFIFETNKKFEMNDLEELYCIGAKFEKNRKACTITMKQRNYVKEVLKCINMEKCKLIKPMFDVNSNLLQFWMRNL